MLKKFFGKKSFWKKRAVYKPRDSQIRLYLVSGAINKSVLNFVCSYEEKHPGTKIELHIVKLEQVKEKDILRFDCQTLLLGVYADAPGGYQCYQELQDRYDLDSMLIGRLPLVLAVGKRTPWAKLKMLTAENVREVPIFNNDSLVNGRLSQVEQLFCNRSIVNGYEAQKELVLNNLGGALFSTLEYQMLFKDDKNVVALPVDIDGFRETNYLALLDKKPMSPEVQLWLKDFCAIL